MTFDSTLSIIDNNDNVRNGVFSPTDIETIVNDLDMRENTSLLNSRLILTLFLVVAGVLAADRFFARTTPNIELPLVNNAEERHLTIDGQFAGWVQCNGVATVPESYIGLMNEPDRNVYICEPTLDTYGCDTTAPTESPTTPFPTISPIATPTEESTTPSSTKSPTDTPTRAPTTRPPTTHPSSLPSASPIATPSDAPTDTPCYNMDGYAFGGDPDHHCFWVAKLSSRSQILCSKRTETREACPSVCGTCCGDSPWFTVGTPWGRLTCEELGQNSVAKSQYCPVTEVETYCPNTCGQCAAYVSMVPSSLIPSNETEAPTDRLDDD